MSNETVCEQYGIISKMNDRGFEQAFKDLNDEQKTAVTTIHGPLLVIAGPGTGKTELLALRAAQILRKDDTMLPGNILCLTFTDNASDNMRRRLVRYIGQDAYQIAVHTFNSFGQYIMNTYPEYFYEWRELQTADELTTHRIIEDVLSALPGSHVLAGRGADGVFYSMKQLKNFISDAKRNNLEPAELKKIIKQNTGTYELLTPIVRKFWPASMYKKDSPLDKIADFALELAQIGPDKPIVEAVVPEKNLILESFVQTAKEAQELASGQTKPYTAWKDHWLKKDGEGKFIFASSEQKEKLEAAIDIYENYQKALEQKGLADFSDQIMWVLRTLQKNKELRYNLQERFQYVMIDEFQDTNRAQLLMAQYITDAAPHGGQPNIMVVGDDDQAIFRFQGADIANVTGFEDRYEKCASVTLVKNYRSTQEILDASRLVGGQIELSLEKQKQITKELVATVKAEGTGVNINEFDDEEQHYAWIAEQIDSLRKKGVKGKEIAGLARERSHLDKLVPYLSVKNIPIDYERRENVLEQDHVITLLHMVRFVVLLGEQRLNEANQLIGPILSEPMWGIKTKDIWELSKEAYQQKKLWLDVIYEQKSGRLREVADFLVNVGNASRSLPAEIILDRLVGIKEEEGFISPFKEYFFAEEILKNNPAQYLTLLSHLSELRRHLRRYQTNSGKILTAKDLVEFVDSYQRTETLRMVDTSPHRENEDAVHLMTVHKAKGLEFDNVFVISLENDSWTKTGRSNRFSYPESLKIIKPADNDSDDSLRLLFVAMTRARRNLQLCYYLKNEDAKAEQPFEALLGLDKKATRPKHESSAQALSAQYEQRWLARHGSLSKTDMKSYLKEDLARYKLSATDLNDFLDVSLGGPLYFLTEHLLKFPSTKPAPASYGTAMHAAMSRAHEQVFQKQKLDIEKVIAAFNEVLVTQPLAPRDLEQYAKEGEETLRYYLGKEAAGFNDNQKVDVVFSDQGVAVAGAQLKGNIDRLDLDKSSKSVIISDYKTGSSESKWELPPSADEYKRIKMHRYKNQLLFYKLLVENSTDWGKHGWHADSGVLRFLKQNQYGRLNAVTLQYDEAELARFTKLIQTVWSKIKDLDFANTSKYPPSIDGIKAFEADLLGEGSAHAS